MREGSREHFYERLDESFPGVKERYIRTYGSTYSCRSPNSKRLMSVFRQECRKHGIICRTDDVFRYMWEFETKERQMSLFE
jgi:hypothetical protein